MVTACVRITEVFRRNKPGGQAGTSGDSNHNSERALCCGGALYITSARLTQVETTLRGLAGRAKDVDIGPVHGQKTDRQQNQQS